MALSHLGDPRQEPGVARAHELPGPRDREQVEEDPGLGPALPGSRPRQRTSRRADLGGGQQRRAQGYTRPRRRQGGTACR